MKDLIKIFSIVVLIMILLVPMTAHGLSITYELDHEFSGATAPTGPTPWITATFDDSFGDASTVRLTMSAINLQASEIVTEWLFNFDSDLDPTLLSFTVVDSSKTGINGIYTGVNAFQADGDGKYDIMFDFPPPPGGDIEFEAGETVIYDITYAGGSAITASSFDEYSDEGGGQGSFQTAAHIQGIGTDAQYSGWIAPSNSVPEPSALILMGSLLIGLGLIKKRKF